MSVQFPYSLDSLAYSKRSFYINNLFKKNTVMRNTILINRAKILAPVLALVLFSIEATTQSIPANFYKPKVDFTTSTIPSSVTIRDVDGDGKPDMVIANSGSNTISLFRNTSTTSSISASSFAARVDFATGINPTIVAIGDLDGDGKPEIVVANRSANIISVLRNTSTSGSINASSFAAKVDFATGTEPLSTVIGDVDGDSKPDLVVSNYNSNTVSVLRNTSTPGSINTSSFAAKVDFATAVAPSIVAFGDVDGDGKPELAVSNFLSNTISVLRNTSTSGSINASSFTDKVDFATGDNPYCVVISDIDGDEKPELVVTNVSSASVSVLHNTCTTGNINGSSFAAKVDFTAGNHPVTVAIGDLDGNGKPDMIVANQLSDNISVLRNTSTTGNINASSFATKTDFATGNQPVSVATGDVDGDGIPEIAATNYNSNTVSVFQITTPLSTAHSWQWAKRPDIELAPYTNPSISTDGNGNTYVTGAFVGTATFATLPSPTILTSAGEADVFIAKYDASGKVLWAKRAGGTHSDAAYSIKYDGFGNLYVAGYFVESTNFDGTIITNPVLNSSNVFLARYNATTGNFLWVRHGAGNDGYTRQAFDVAVDQYGDAYITGEFGGNTTTFGSLPPLSSANRWWDVFVVKYNSAGVVQWQTSVGTLDAGYNGEGGTGIAVDQTGKVFVTGYFNGSSTYPTQFGNIDLVSNGGGGFYEYDYFLAKYDPSTSTWLWAVNGGGAANDYSKSVSLDSDGNPYVSGVFTGTATFGSNSLTSTGGNDYFIAKYSTDGVLTWIHSSGGIGYFGGNRSKVDANGNFYFAGTFDGTVTVGDATITSTGFDNCYISYWDKNGVFQWVKHIPGSYYGHVSSIDIESNGNINFLEVFAQSETFDCTVLNAGSFTSLAIAKLGISNSGSQAPIITASSNPVCNGGNTVLSINSDNFNNATVWKWYTGSCGGILIGTGNSITVNPSSATIYYVRGESGCSGPGACASITITMGHVDVTIQDVKALNHSGVPFNTVYPAYTPASSITITAQPSGTGPYSYNWSNGATTQSITVSPSSNTIYTVTVTDASGCVGTASKEVIVKNVNCGNGKVYMCHIAGNSGHVNTICIDNNAVATHLAAGCSLGECTSSRNAPSAIETEVTDLKINIIPNPSNNYFNLVINTNDASPVSFRIMDVLGRVVEMQNNLPVSEKYTFGNGLKPGVYLAEIIQGKNRKVIRLLKK